ncbi:MAG: twin-arginine translocase TatA/TatE family subunit [Candidatus Thermoplasmatota archaeon]|jgi:sec-independent protein translocase protein TatA|nr:twin-arginine translocase TatA/TatE family subunit [Candidatus Thermoplasmatota archaeon]MCL5790200.1 twin-arginine translocase TatA/TatE family subunit [Candidatus Thermoplasmatota archaeon]
MLGSPTDWIILIVVVLLVLGGSKKIPEIARAMGRSMGEFKKGRMEVEREINEAVKTDPAPGASQK